MSLPEQSANEQGQERDGAVSRANPELEARLDNFIAENPQWQNHYLTMGSKEVARRMMLARMARAETADRRARELEPWVKENPDIIAKVDERLKAMWSRLP